MYQKGNYLKRKLLCRVKKLRALTTTEQQVRRLEHHRPAFCAQLIIAQNRANNVIIRVCARSRSATTLLNFKLKYCMCASDLKSHLSIPLPIGPLPCVQLTISVLKLSLSDSALDLYSFHWVIFNRT